MDNYGSDGGTDIADLFRLDPQATPAKALPAFDSEDCTNDGCTGSCVGC
jgi:hypothetical protein